MTRILTSIKETRQERRARLEYEQALIEKAYRSLTEGTDWCKDVHERAEENSGYVAGGTQWRQGDIERQEAKGRPHFTMNKILQVVNAIANKEITQRFVPK